MQKYRNGLSFNRSWTAGLTASNARQPAGAQPIPRQQLSARFTQPAVVLGNHEDGGEVFWAPFETENRLLNFGVLVTGDSGSGKTQTLNVLIDGVARMGLPVCIFDFKNDYSAPDFAQDIGLRVHDVRRYGIPFNPLVPSASWNGQAQPVEHIFTLAGVLKRVFNLGDRQAAVLREAMKEAFERRGIDPQKWVDAGTIRAPSFDDVVAILEERKAAKNAQATGILDRLAPLFELGLFPKSGELSVPFEAMLDERLVLSLFALPADDIKAALAELIIIRLHGVLVSRPQPRKLTRLLVLDEAWRVAKSAHLENLARESRAFGAGIAIGTQYPGDLPANLSGALDTKIYLKNQHPDHRKAVVKALCGTNSSAELEVTLERLTQFEGLIQNQQYLSFARFRLVPYFARRIRGLPHTNINDVAEEPRTGEPRPVSAFLKSAGAKTKDRGGEAASKWLAARLADGEWHDSASIIGPAFQEKGISKPTLYRARDLLDVVTRKRTDSDRFDWRLPIMPAPKSAEIPAQPAKNVAVTLACGSEVPEEAGGDRGQEIDAFIAQCLDFVAGSFVPSTPLYTAWQAWCKSHGIYAGTQTAFSRRVKTRIAHDRNNNRPRYMGITIRNTKTRVPPTPRLAAFTAHPIGNVARIVSPMIEREPANSEICIVKLYRAYKTICAADGKCPVDPNNFAGAIALICTKDGLKIYDDGSNIFLLKVSI